MASPFLTGLSFKGEDGRLYDLFITKRALRFSDGGEQNMVVVPRSQVTSLTVKDTDQHWSTADMPRATGFATLSGLVSAGASRWAASGKVHPSMIDVCTLAGAGMGFYAGLQAGSLLFRNQHLIDGSMVEIHTTGATRSFACGDSKAREFVRMFC